jgi:hypothetical protein
MKTLQTVLLIFLLAGTGRLAWAEPPMLMDNGMAAPGTKVNLHVRQVIPGDGLSRGERMLNGDHPVKPGDVFTAEWPVAPGESPIILAGCVNEVVPPRRFGRPGSISVQIAWPFDASGNQWSFDIEDQRFTSAQKRRAITALFLAEGFALGASVGSNIDQGKSGATLGGGGVGMVLGLAYASLQPGQAASLEPGDTLEVVVGSSEVRKLPPEVPLKVYPAHEPEKHGHAHARRIHVREKSQ